ncbi:MAG TPA: LamG-like jellyroll fold domain-containing protein [Chthonomonas sp.]|uniref:LamG-like jellyroll fold domain-containing protein n=1 Tax=Chthonomonas sp. TaxID=2282153 RepID=UPI002B4AE1FF|nr:LamG-like jellyroll fold domain-containing protein [Chthonomonas sp.]HLI48359.1 LamG-like jellyroll fold domain-containing protein [Chthonomonas sp.]
MYRLQYRSLLCTLLATLLVAVGAYQTFGATPKHHNAGMQPSSDAPGLDASPDLVFALHDYATEARLMMGFGGCFTFNNVPAQNDQFVGVLPAPGRFGGMTGFRTAEQGGHPLQFDTVGLFNRTGWTIVFELMNTQNSWTSYPGKYITILRLGSTVSHLEVDIANGSPRLLLQTFGPHLDGSTYQITATTRAGYTTLWRPNTWHEITVTYDGTTLWFYVDAILIGSRTVAEIPPFFGPMLLLGNAPTRPSGPEWVLSNLRIYSLPHFPGPDGLTKDTVSAQQPVNVLEVHVNRPLGVTINPLLCGLSGGFVLGKDSYWRYRTGFRIQRVNSWIEASAISFTPRPGYWRGPTTGFYFYTGVWDRTLQYFSEANQDIYFNLDGAPDAKLLGIAYAAGRGATLREDHYGLTDSVGAASIVPSLSISEQDPTVRTLADMWADILYYILAVKKFPPSKLYVGFYNEPNLTYRAPGTTDQPGGGADISTFYQVVMKLVRNNVFLRPYLEQVHHPFWFAGETSGPADGSSNATKEDQVVAGIIALAATKGNDCPLDGITYHEYSGDPNALEMMRKAVDAYTQECHLGHRLALAIGETSMDAHYAPRNYAQTANYTYLAFQNARINAYGAAYRAIVLSEAQRLGYVFKTDYCGPLGNGGGPWSYDGRYSADNHIFATAWEDVLWNRMANWQEVAVTSRGVEFYPHAAVSPDGTRLGIYLVYMRTRPDLTPTLTLRLGKEWAHARCYRWDINDQNNSFYDAGDSCEGLTTLGPPQVDANGTATITIRPCTICYLEFDKRVPITNLSKPATPQLKAVPVYGGVDLSWSEVAGAESYEVWRIWKDTAGEQHTYLVYEGKGTAVDDRGDLGGEPGAMLSPQLSYTYRVYAIDRLGGRSRAASLSISPLAQPSEIPPPKPTRFTVSCLYGRFWQNVALQWEPSTTPDFYCYRLYNGNNDLLAILPHRQSTWYWMANLKADTTYLFRLVQVNTSGVESLAAILMVTTGTQRHDFSKFCFEPPLPPSRPQVKIDGRTITLIWSKSPSQDVAGYAIYRWGVANRRVLLGKCEATQYQDVVLAAGTYTYEIVAFTNTDLGGGNLSKPVEITVKAAPVGEGESP